MSRKIALSNLALLPGSLLRGPQWTWAIAEKAGFDALKVSPLRGWEASGINAHHISIAAYEIPRCTSTNFISDICLFGRSAEDRGQGYADLFPDAVNIDCSRPLGPDVIHARRPPLGKSGSWPTDIDHIMEYLSNWSTRELICLDTGHIRKFWHFELLSQYIVTYGHVGHIVVRTHAYKEWLALTKGGDSLLVKQLLWLVALPDSVGASVEISPWHLLRLQCELRLSRHDVLYELRARTQQFLSHR